MAAVTLRRTGIKRGGEMRRGRPLVRSRLIVKRRKDQVTPAMRLAVLVRDGYRCVCCGAAPLDLDRWQCHHRLLRSRGGLHQLPNLIALCAACHAWQHGHDTDASRMGFIVPSWADPARVPVLRHGLRWELPDEAWRPGIPAEWQVAA